MTGVRPRHDTIPDVIEITLYYWDTCKWIVDEEKPKSIRFHIIGKAMGPCRWRPHLIQYKDSLPIQGKKDFNIIFFGGGPISLTEINFFNNGY